MSSLPKPPQPRNGLHEPKRTNDIPWQELVAQKVASLHYGVVQIVIHDSRVVQVESTERFRFDPPRASSTQV
jgi:hypothetical protein